MPRHTQRSANERKPASAEDAEDARDEAETITDPDLAADVELGVAEEAARVQRPSPGHSH